MSTKIHSSPRNSRSGTLSHDRAILEVPLSDHDRVGLQNVIQNKTLVLLHVCLLVCALENHYRS